MKHGSITSHLRWRNIQNNGLKEETRLQRSQKTVPSAGMIMVSLFWDNFHWLSSNRKNNQCLALWELIATFEWRYYKKKFKKAYLAEKKELFHQDNAPVHVFSIVTAKIKELKFQLLSQYMTISDYFLFANLKKRLNDKKFGKNEEMKSAINSYFE